MSPRILSLFTIAVLAAGGAGCSKPAEPAAPETPSEARPDENIVTLTAENLKHISLKTEPATLGSLGRILQAAGRISVNLNRTAKVTSTFEGRLTQLNFDLNDHVQSGQVLAVVESPEMPGKPLELKAPIDGVIIERKATTGELVNQATEIYTISDPAELWAIAEVKERDIAAVKVGQDAAFAALAYPGEKFHGKVVLVGNVLLIPDGALQTEGADQIVFVAHDGNTFERRVVKLGWEQAGRVQILSGVQAGENIVTDGSFILKSEMLKGQLGEE